MIKLYVILLVKYHTVIDIIVDFFICDPNYMGKSQAPISSNWLIISIIAYKGSDVDLIDLNMIDKFIFVSHASSTFAS